MTKPKPKTVEEMIQTRFQKDRPSQMISMRIPVDVIEDLKEIAPKLGFTGYRGLIKAYISHGLRKHLEEFRVPQLRVPRTDPGSAAARALGCTCPVADNEDLLGVRDHRGRLRFVISGDCPLHNYVIDRPNHDLDLD